MKPKKKKEAEDRIVDKVVVALIYDDVMFGKTPKITLKEDLEILEDRINAMWRKKIEEATAHPEWFSYPDNAFKYIRAKLLDNKAASYLERLK